MKIVKVLYIGLLGMTVFISASVSDPVTVSFDLDSAVLEERGQLKQLKYYPSENTIKLMTVDQKLVLYRLVTTTMHDGFMFLLKLHKTQAQSLQIVDTIGNEQEAAEREALRAVSSSDNAQSGAAAILLDLIKKKADSERVKRIAKREKENN